MRRACSRVFGSRAESGDSQCRPVETLETTRPALSTLRRRASTCASVVDIWNQGTSPNHSSTPSYPDFLISSRPCSKLQSLGIMLSPMDFFIAFLKLGNWKLKNRNWSGRTRSFFLLGLPVPSFQFPFSQSQSLLLIRAQGACKLELAAGVRSPA